MWKKMASAHWLQDGDKDAPIVLYVFADPFCPYCKQFWQQSRPRVDAGKVQIRTLLVGVIKPESRSLPQRFSPVKIRRKHGMITSNRTAKWP